MGANDWLLYIIANTVDPYGYELPIILGYPSGCTYRARFKREWIDPGLENSLSTLPGVKCVIVYRDFAAAKLYPIRLGTVKRVDTYGEVVYIEYELGSIVPYHNSADVRREQMRLFNEEWSREHPEPAKTNRPSEHMKPLVLRSKYEPHITNPYFTSKNEASREFESWSNLGDLVADIPLYSEMEFLRIVGLGYDLEGGSESPREGMYELLPGRTYELRVAQRIFRAQEQVKPHEMRFICDGHGLRAITERRRAVGKYDVLSFRFQTDKPGARPSTGVLSVVGQMSRDRPFELELLAHIRPEWRIRGLLMTAVGFLALLWPEFVIHLGIQPDLLDVVQRIGIILFVIGVFDSRSILEYFR